MYVYCRHFWRKHPQYTQLDFSLISQFWSFVPTGVDAVSENSDKDEILLFKGKCAKLILLYISSFWIFDHSILKA